MGPFHLPAEVAYFIAGLLTATWIIISPVALLREHWKLRRIRKDQKAHEQPRERR